jgi:hypothetical protein
MKKFLLTLICILTCGLIVFAGEKEDAIAFFNSYANAANTYNPVLITYYSPSAKIIRQVVKPDGTTANVITDTKTYIHQMKISQGVAKARKYTNSYSNVNIFKVQNGYKITALRQPKGETYKLKMYQIVQKQSNGKWLIVEEMMQTKEQILLKYAK